MSRAYRYTVIGLGWIFAIMLHYLGVEFFAPGTAIYELGAPAVGLYIDSGWRVNMYVVITQRIPIIIVAGVTLWGFASEYEQQSGSRGGYR